MCGDVSSLLYMVRHELAVLSARRAMYAHVTVTVCMSRCLVPYVPCQVGESQYWCNCR